MATLPAGTNVLLNFDDFPSPVDNQPLPANYAGCTWNTLVQGSPWAGDNTWNIYIANGGPQGTIVFPRPVMVRSVRVSSVGSNVFTLSSSGNPDVTLTTSGSSPQILTTNWTNAVTSLTLQSSTNDQLFDDLRLTTSGDAVLSVQIAPNTPTATRTLDTPITTPTIPYSPRRSYWIYLPVIIH
jgi:hypothetical protein